MRCENSMVDVWGQRASLWRQGHTFQVETPPCCPRRLQGCGGRGACELVRARPEGRGVGGRQSQLHLTSRSSSWLNLGPLPHSPQDRGMTEERGTVAAQKPVFFNLVFSWDFPPLTQTGLPAPCLTPSWPSLVIGPWDKRFLPVLQCVPLETGPGPLTPGTEFSLRLSTVS